LGSVCFVTRDRARRQIGVGNRETPVQFKQARGLYGAMGAFLDISSPLNCLMCQTSTKDWGGDVWGVASRDVPVPPRESGRTSRCDPTRTTAGRLRPARSPRAGAGPWCGHSRRVVWSQWTPPPNITPKPHPSESCDLQLRLDRDP